MNVQIGQVLPPHPTIRARLVPPSRPRELGPSSDRRVQRHPYRPRWTSPVRPPLPLPLPQLTSPLSVLDSKIPHSICYHLADIYVDEIEAALSKPIDGSEGTKSTCVPLLALLEPFYTTLSICPSKAMFARIADNVFIPLFEATIPKPDPALKRRKIASETVVPTFPSIGQYALERVNKHDVADDEYVGKAMLAELFTVGGKETTGDVNRSRMYALHRERGEHLEADGE